MGVPIFISILEMPIKKGVLVYQTLAQIMLTDCILILMVLYTHVKKMF